MAEAVHVMLAKAQVYDKVNISPEHKGDVEAAVGDDVNIRFAYKAFEKSQDEDHWTFRLAVTVDGEEEAVSERIHVDRKLISDDILSHVGVDLHFPIDGEFTIRYTCTAKLARREWGDKSPPAVVSEDTYKGTFTLRVHGNA